MTRLARLGFAFVLVPSIGFAQSGARPNLFDRLAGHWVLDGTIHGAHTIHDIDADAVLNGGYIRLHEVSREKDARGSAAYEAVVYISVDGESGDYTCLWLDSTTSGGLSPSGIGRAHPDGQSIPFVFTAGNGDLFRTTFEYTPESDSWRWRMDTESNGRVEPFARATLTRRAVSPR